MLSWAGYAAWPVGIWSDGCHVLRSMDGSPVCSADEVASEEVQFRTLCWAGVRSVAGENSDGDRDRFLLRAF